MIGGEDIASGVSGVYGVNDATGQDRAYLARNSLHAYLPGENKDLLPKDTRPLLERIKSRSKIVPSLEEAVRLSGLRDGMTVSFHHHFRNGDNIVNPVLDTLARMGFRNLRVAASSLNDVHEPMIGHIRAGVVDRIETSGLRGGLAEAVSRGLMAEPVVFRSHGGRAAAIQNGALHIDVAFLGAPSCDPYGNVNGYSREGQDHSACGSMGYARVDAQFADKVVALTDNIVPYPNTPFGIPQSQVDYIVEVDSVGEQAKIMTGATRQTKNPRDLLIAEKAAEVVIHSGYFVDGFSIQTGSGGAALAVTRFIRDEMAGRGVRASFALGGITGQIVRLHEEGLIKKLLDVQSFDVDAVESLKNNRFHQQIDANYYANPYNKGSAVNELDVVVLSALEIDENFNVNVLTGSDGVIRGAIGGHQDTAAGAALSVLVGPLVRGRIPTVLRRVNTVVTPGDTVDVFVSDQGCAVNPRRPEVAARLARAGVDVYTMDELRRKAERMTGEPDPLPFGDKVVGVVTYRDGSVLDLIYDVRDS
jgi:citrate lyase subunit alpha/citrate CoA-transferase